MATPTDWNKHSAIAGYGSWLLGAGSIVVALWLGLRTTATAQTVSNVTDSIKNSQPERVMGGPAGAIPPYFFLIGLCYLIAMLAAGYLHLKAARLIHSPKGGRSSAPDASTGSVDNFDGRPLHYDVGRRIESALYGANGYTPASIVERLRGMKEGQELPVNHYAMQIEDPAPGQDKFLTVTLSETVRQGDIFKSPRAWLQINSSMPAKGPVLRVHYEIADSQEYLRFEADKEVRRIRFDPLLSTRSQQINLFQNMPPIRVGSFERCRIGVANQISGQSGMLRDAVRPEDGVEHTVTAYYEDEIGHTFGAAFRVYRHGDGVEWKLMVPPRLQGA